MAQANHHYSSFPVHTCRPSDIKRVSFDGAGWQAIRVDGHLYLREDELEEIVDGAIDAETWLAELREDDLLWVVTSDDERTFVRIDGAHRVAAMRPIMSGSAHHRFLVWAEREAAKAGPHRRRYGHLAVIDGDRR